MLYAFRIDKEENYDFLYLQKYGKVFLTFEVSSIEKKPHYHGVIDTDKISNFRTCLRNHGFVKGTYSISEIKDKNNYVPYIIKDGNIIVNQVFSEHEMVQFKLIDTKKKHDIAYSKKPNKPTYLKQMICDFMNSEPLSDNSLEACTLFVKYYTKKNHVMIDKFILKRFILTLCNVKYGFDYSFWDGIIRDIKKDFSSLD